MRKLKTNIYIYLLQNCIYMLEGALLRLPNKYQQNELANVHITNKLLLLGYNYFFVFSNWRCTVTSSSLAFRHHCI